MSRHITSAVSQSFAKFANKKFSKPIQNFVNNSYVNLMGLDMSEFHSPNTYSSLNALFTRKLREDRMYSLDADDFISPCDSLISECGELQEEYALQIKGMRYKSDELLGDNFSQEEKSIVNNGTFVNFYLSPKDYHRYHIPTNLKVIKAVHIPGKFYPVNIPSLKKRVNLFIENERVVLLCETTNKKRFYMVLVSALNVGVMQVSFEPKIKTNADAFNSSVYSYADLHLNKGDDFGCFEMGSTIVILAEKGMLELDIKAGDNVKYSDTIAKII
ncbi:phosphatidylserine decarboxylase [Candidatus Sulfurimonas marisnigri]|uniref:phosphatidylserine decarboxylase n=1 Tax=Candidatus Sulfurimonas marisnigri TaxID=2740405 RepID=A0A7S7M2D6_9BACT|nr:phosphatidylserine decarboxylase [Candidatus Sulfurimonas marisnigri]QOY55807.1 phosphatidylserine decarboxylase [Candidatus Sulfurimonas marisnigri]